MELHRRQRRKRALAALRKHYQEASSESDKKALWIKAIKISPLLTKEQFEA